VFDTGSNRESAAVANAHKLGLIVRKHVPTPRSAVAYGRMELWEER